VTAPAALTPIQKAISLVLGAYTAACNRLARDYLAERGDLETWERAA
jgi:hypothetical protein